MFKSNTTAATIERFRKPKYEEQGAYWRGIAHSVLIEAMKQECSSLKWNILGEHYTASKNQNELSLAFHSTDTFIGAINSNQGRKGLRFFCGTYTKDGLAIPLYATKSHKHTNRVDVKERISSAMTELMQAMDLMSSIVESLNQRPSELELSVLLKRAGVKSYMPWSRLGAINKLFMEYDCGSSWDLIHCFAQVATRNPALKYLEQVYGFTQSILSLYQEK